MKYALLPLILIGCITEPPVTEWQPIPNLTAPKYGGRTLNDVQKCINWYPEKTDDGWVMQFAPGAQSFGSVANNAACRGSLYSPNSDKIYSIHGNTGYQTSSGGGAATALTGTMTTSSGQGCRRPAP